MGEAVKGLAAVLGGIIAIAIVAVIVSPNAQSPGVIGALTSGLASLIGAAVAPVSGGGENASAYSGSAPAGALDYGASAGYYGAPGGGVVNGLTGATQSIYALTGLTNASSGLYNTVAGDFGGAGGSGPVDFTG